MDVSPKSENQGSMTTEERILAEPIETGEMETIAPAGGS